MSQDSRRGHKFTSLSFLSTTAALLLATGSVTHAQKAPDESLKTFKVADGVECRLFASEPMFSNPCDIDVDAYGRVWVTEGVNYRGKNGQRKEGDRIVILEDTDGDGKADKSTVFYQGPEINAALGICVLGNKVIVSCSPNVFLFTDTDGDGKADKKEILFTGISGVQHDHGVHAFVFGPDGKLYFNMGNDGQQIKRPDGKPVVDASGVEVAQNKKHPDSRSGPYRQGLVFRMNPDGTEFETLGWNFRNNYEVNVDSFGTLWQSDNDDDGNRGVRINYVMEFGNYGYTDELTGAGWSSPRTNIEADSPQRHWHLNDPGVVPNLLQTGNGSPTGICIYEGSLLPEVFRNQILHCDAGPNVVRAYPVTNDGAGYKATTVNLIQGGDQWFRPSDVCVAPDGSVMVADWYDPGVGGHAMGDSNRGRIFRLAPPATAYNISKFDLSTPAGAADALTSPNMARRYLAWTALNDMGDKAEAELLKLWNSDNPRLRARAIHLLARIKGKEAQYILSALKDKTPDIRITGLRIARQFKLDLIPIVKALVNDESPQVRRECAIALRHNTQTEAADLWAELALKHDGKDRWYLEALGLAADRQEDAFLAAYLKRIDQRDTPPGMRDILWRSRGKEAPAMLAKLILDEKTTNADRPRYFRAYDFLTPQAREDALIELLKADHTDKTIGVESLTRLKGSPKLAAMPELVQKILDSAVGTPAFVSLVEQLNVKNRDEQLLAVALANYNNQTGANAIRIILNNGNPKLIEPIQEGVYTKDAEKLIFLLGNSNNSFAVSLLAYVATDRKAAPTPRNAAVAALSRSKPGADELFNLIKGNKLTEDQLAIAAKELHASAIPAVRQDAKTILPLPASKDGKPLPPLSKLLESKGTATAGQLVFKNNCLTCHQVKNEGVFLGPPLTEVGSKLSREAMFTSILFPSASIEHNYAGRVLKLKNGDIVTGIVSSDTDAEIALRSTGGVITTYKKSDIASNREQKESIMPEDLQKGMTAQELVDVVEYLMTLKK